MHYPYYYVYVQNIFKISYSPFPEFVRIIIRVFFSPCVCVPVLVLAVVVVHVSYRIVIWMA